jgi:hypothetical protein
MKSIWDSGAEVTHRCPGATVDHFMLPPTHASSPRRHEPEPPPPTNAGSPPRRSLEPPHTGAAPPCTEAAIHHRTLEPHHPSPHARATPTGAAAPRPCR